MDDLLSIGVVSQHLGLPTHTIRRLTDAGILHAHLTDGGHRRYLLDEVIADYQRHQPEWAGPFLLNETLPLNGLAEDAVWLGVRPRLVASEAAIRIAGYAFTEMLNNAIDHSQGTAVHIQVFQGNTTLAIRIHDDGIGAFENLRVKLALPDLQAAVQEINKGKATSDPAKHTGEGIFFTSKAVDRFSISANSIEWIVDNRRADMTVASSTNTGTLVQCEVANDTHRTLPEVFREYTNEDYAFTRTRPVIKLYETGTDFVSRSEAKRLGARLDEFESVTLDFAGVESVGQGFVDELFRVWAEQHPEVELQPINMSADVGFMVNRGLRH